MSITMTQREKLLLDLTKQIEKLQWKRDEFQKWALATKSVPVPGWRNESFIMKTTKAIQGEAEDCKSAIAWSVFSGYATPKSTTQHSDLTENEKRTKNVGSYRLFGIDLMKPSTPTTRMEEFLQEQNRAGGFMEEDQGHSLDSATDSDQKSDVSKLSQENKHNLLLTSPKDTQSKQSSTRTCTKGLSHRRTGSTSINAES